MAGFMIFVGADTDAHAAQLLEQTATSGVYGARLRPPANGRWRESQEGTFADYATIRAGDSIFFFSRRKIYGIGKAVEVGGDCKYLNFPDASLPEVPDYESTRPLMLRDEGSESLAQRWLCLFEPAPAVFMNGVDIDDVLSSDPRAFRALRAMQSVTFARMDDAETQALSDVILRANERGIREGKLGKASFKDESAATHADIAARVSDQHKLSSAPLLGACAAGDYLRHEMALEAGLVFQLARADIATSSTFGQWDYVTHQVLASPFKPLDWADRMDVFGYSYLPGYVPTISRFLVIEAKKDEATIEVVDQVMKYVDWVKEEYAGDRYSSIRAFVVAYDFSTAVRDRAQEGGRRLQTVGRRPAVIEEWANLRLVRYAYDDSDGTLKFTDVSSAGDSS